MQSSRSEKEPPKSPKKAPKTPKTSGQADAGSLWVIGGAGRWNEGGWQKRREEVNLLWSLQEIVRCPTRAQVRRI